VSKMAKDEKIILKDKDIREPLCDFLDELHYPNRVLEEKDIGRSRADMMMITKEAVFGIEIKSDADTYTRLSRQIPDYDAYFDYNYIVVGTSHAGSVSDKVPEHWGIITVEVEETQIDFYQLRKPQPNRNWKWESKLRLLWRPEMAKIQEKTDMPKYAYLSKLNLIGKIIEKVEPVLLQELFCEALMERDYNTIAQTINEYREANNQKKRKKRKYKRRKKS